MIFPALNILLAVAWMFIWGRFDLAVFLAGLILGCLLLGPLSLVFQNRPYGRRLWRLSHFFFYFIRILIKANWDVAKVVLKPGFNEQCRIIRYPVGDLTDVQLTSLSHSITLTPGTLSLDVSDDNQWLYIHCMIGHDRQAVERDIDDLRRHVLEEFLSS